MNNKGQFLERKCVMIRTSIFLLCFLFNLSVLGETQKPQLVDLFRWPDSVDRRASADERAVTFRWHVVSDAEMWRGGIAMASSSGRMGRWSTWNGTELISGTPYNGIYESSFLVGHDFETGDWFPQNSQTTGYALWLDDLEGNRTGIRASELNSMFDVIVEVRPVPVPFQAGDANRNHMFDQIDLLDILLSNKYMTDDHASWKEGDFSGDGLFDQNDIVLMLQTGNYLNGSYAATVPEASSIALMMIGLFLVCLRRGL